MEWTRTLKTGRPRFTWSFRVRLRAVFIMMAILSVALGLATRWARRQHEAVKWVQGSGGRVVYDYQGGLLDCDLGLEYRSGFFGPNGEMIPARRPAATWFRALLGWDNSATIVIVDMSDTEVANLSPVSVLTRLQALYLNDCQITDLSPLWHLTGLKYVDLRGTPVSDKEIAKLRQALPDCTICR